VTATSLSVFADCPRRYYLEEFLGWEGGREQSGAGTRPSGRSAAETGTMVHALLAGKPGDYPDDVRQLASVFEHSDTAAQASQASYVAREWDFIMEIDGIFVQGVIDLWYQNERGITIVDYKTDAKVEPERHAPQLAIYGAAIERATGRRPARALLHYLRSDTLVEITAGDPIPLIKALREAQETLAFPTRPADRCHACPFFRTSCLPY